MGDRGSTAESPGGDEAGWICAACGNADNEGASLTCWNCGVQRTVPGVEAADDPLDADRAQGGGVPPTGLAGPTPGFLLIWLLPVVVNLPYSLFPVAWLYFPTGFDEVIALASGQRLSHVQGIFFMAGAWVLYGVLSLLSIIGRDPAKSACRAVLALMLIVNSVGCVAGSRGAFAGLH